MFWLYLCLFLSFVLLIPIPIKATFNIENTNFIVKIYNKTLLSNETIRNRKSTEKKPISKKKDKGKLKKDSSKKFSIQLLLHNLRKNIFKPWLRFNFKCEYCLDDAATTAISYGLLYNINPILYILFSSFFKLSKFDIALTPRFSNTLELKANSKVILIFNLFQVLLIFYYIKKSYIKIKKEVPS